MTILAPKQPTEAVLYEFSFAPQFKSSDDRISTYTLTRTSGTVAIDTDYNGDAAVYAVLSGGVNGETATFLLTIQTVLEQTLNRVLSLYVSNTAIAISNSTSTKRQIVEVMFEEIGLAGYEFDATPEEQASALRRLDALMAQWAASSMDLGYNFPQTIGGSDLDDASGVPDLAFNTVAMSLALRMNPAIGKTQSPEARVALGQGMNVVRAYCATIPERQFPTSTARGAGAKPWGTWNPFLGVGNG